MAEAEIDSFLGKFKLLCSNGINASLNINSSNGRAIVTLHADLGLINASPCVTQTPLKRRSPAYERRRLARRHARRISTNDNLSEEAAEASNILIGNVLHGAEKPNNLNMTEKDETEKSDIKNGAVKPVLEDNILNKAVKPVVDSCEDSVAEIATSETGEVCNGGEDEDVMMDEHEMKLDKVVEEVIVYAVPPSDCREKMQNIKEVENEIKSRFSSIGVTVRDFHSKASREDLFHSSLVKITPVNLRMIWGRRLGLRNCAVTEMKQSAVQ